MRRVRNAKGGRVVECEPKKQCWLFATSLPATTAPVSPEDGRCHWKVRPPQSLGLPPAPWTRFAMRAVPGRRPRPQLRVATVAVPVLLLGATGIAGAPVGHACSGGGGAHAREW